MADFAGLQSFKASLSYPEMSTSMELMTQYEDMDASVMGNPNLSLHGLMGCFSNDNFLSQQPEFPAQFGDNLPGFFQSDGLNSLLVPQPMASVGDDGRENRKRKVVTASESSSGNSTTPVSGTGSEEKVTNKRKNGPGRGKRGRCCDKEVEKPKEVVHVRARRGQATDSHSLAERVRREKINERMRCLQDLVPGCYKTMGMAVMLDEIINYVQSLQNQVEFLSMKLSAASSLYDFSLEMEAMQVPQATNAYEVQLQGMERLVREGYGGVTSFHSTMPL